MQINGALNAGHIMRLFPRRPRDVIDGEYATSNSAGEVGAYQLQEVCEADILCALVIDVTIM